MSLTPESVKQLLESSDFGDRLKGINQLRQLDPTIAFELIQPVIHDSNVRVRYAAVSQLASLGKQDLEQSEVILRDLLLHDPEPDIQAAAADSIGALQLINAFEDMQERYNMTSEWLVKFSIIAALGELGTSQALGLLEDALNSGNDLMQTAAIGSLGELGDERAVPLLLPFASHADWQIRYRIAQAISRFRGIPEVDATLMTLTQDAIEQVAQEAQSYVH